jgi:hypothetical protein
MDVKEKESIERAIVKARNGVGESIDELDRQIRKTLDVQTIASEHAPQLVAGGAVVGFLVGFGFPKLLKRVLQVGVPLALMAYGVKQAKARSAAAGPARPVV